MPGVESKADRWIREASVVMAEPVEHLVFLGRRRVWGLPAVIAAPLAGVAVAVTLDLSTGYMALIELLLVVVAVITLPVERSFLVATPTRLARLTSGRRAMRPTAMAEMVWAHDLRFTDADRMRITIGGRQYTVGSTTLVRFQAMQRAYGVAGITTR